MKGRQTALGAALLGVGAALCVGSGAPALAQDATAVDVAPRALVAASEEYLWIARMEEGRCVLLRRTPTGVQARSAPTDLELVRLVAVGDGVYAFTADGSLYRYTDDWGPGRDLPGRAIPLDVLGVDDVLYAIVDATVAEQLPLYDLAAGVPTSQPFERAESPYVVVRYDRRGWFVVAETPARERAEERPSPRIAWLQGALTFFWVGQRSEQIHYARLDLGSGRWGSVGTMGVPGVEAYWATVANRMSTLVARVSDGAGALRVLRRVPGSGSDEQWIPAEVTWSPMPEGAVQGEARHALGFNQHLGLLTADGAGNFFVRFGRFDGAPTMATYEIFAEPALPSVTANFHTFAAAVLVVLLVTLFAFRRSAIAMPADLPIGTVPALTVQRLAGLAIDLLPFTLVAAPLVGVSWMDALREMAAWAFDPQLNEFGLPEPRYFAWWAVSVGAYTAYALTMELASRRTLGKIVLRLVVYGDDGRKPAAWRTVVRNAFRLLELMPPFWILGFMVLLTRNRQRTGDLFARTVVVRRVAVLPPDKPDDSGEAE